MFNLAKKQTINYLLFRYFYLILKRFETVIISKTIIQNLINKHPDVENALEKWYDDIKTANWKNFSEVKRTFNAADRVGNDSMFLILKGINTVWSL